MKTPSSWRRKLDRARKHAKEINREAEAFWDRKGDRFGTRFYFDPNIGEYIGEITAVPSPPPRWDLIVGDAVHNYRSALDHIFWHLPRSKAAWKRAAFPICTTPECWRSDITVKCLDGLRDTAVEAVKQFQPYQGGYRFHRKSLALLAKYDNDDKHREIHPILFVGHRVDLAYDTDRLPVTYLEILSDARLKVGAKFVRMTLSRPPKGQPPIEARFRGDVAFSERTQISVLLDQFDRAVETVFLALEPFIL